MSCKELSPHRVKFAKVVLEPSSVTIDEINNPLGLENILGGSYSKAGSLNQVGATFSSDDVYSFNPVTIDTEV